MFKQFHTRATLALLLGYAVLAYSPTQAAGDRVNFETGDGVTLEGTYYSSAQGKKAPCVMILHNFDRKGGNRNQQGIDALANKLQAKGFAVLTFDFRGYGNSNKVAPNFWKAQHNLYYPGARLANPPGNIQYDKFPQAYHKNLINDVAAAKAFLDRENDAMALNSRNLIVLGLGEGATVGTLWMASEFKRYQANVMPPMFLGQPPILQGLANKSEGADLLCGVFVGISPTLYGASVPLSGRLTDIGKTQKLPLVFLYGNEDKQADTYTGNLLRLIVPNFVRGKPPADPDYAYTGEKAFPTKLTGHQLLQIPEVPDFIVEYCDKVVKDKSQNQQWNAKNYNEQYYYWCMSPTILNGAIEAKAKGENMPKVLPLRFIGMQ